MGDCSSTDTPRDRGPMTPDKLREIAAWLDTLDAAARVLFENVESIAPGWMAMSEADTVRALEAVTGTEVQDDLRRWADEMAAADAVLPPDSPPVAAPLTAWVKVTSAALMDQNDRRIVQGFTDEQDGNFDGAELTKALRLLSGPRVTCPMCFMWRDRPNSLCDEQHEVCPQCGNHPLTDGYCSTCAWPEYVYPADRKWSPDHD